MNSLFIKDKDGKLIFMGKEDPHNPPVKQPKGSQMQCPVCKGMFDFLLGEDTPDGGVMGCEKDWKPAKVKKGGTNENNQNEGFV